MNTIRLNKNNLNKVLSKTVHILKRGGLVVFPTDTVYGLLVDATSETAVKKLIEFKERPKGKAISVFVSKVQTINTLCQVSDKQNKILNKILPGPFTVALDYKKENSKYKINKLLLSEKNTLGIRVPDYELLNKLCQLFEKPITATSANTSGTNPYHSLASLLKNLSDKKKKTIDLIVDAGKLPLNKPSTVVDLTKDKIVELRSGDLSLENIKKHISNSAIDTKIIAKNFIKSIYKNQKKPIVIILQGELGSGKTIFTKGIGEFLGIKDIISPSFVTYYEYDLQTKSEKGKSKSKKQVVNKFVHGDFYYIKDEEELEDLKLTNYLNNPNILSIEWGEKGGSLIEIMKKKADVYLIQIKYLSETKRKLIIGKLNK